jgi:NTE family protein
MRIYRFIACACKLRGKAGYSCSPLKTLQQELEGRRFGLVLSAGFFGFYGHAGFLKALWACGLRPAAYAGTSAGGLVAAHAAAGASIEALEQNLLAQTRQHFWDPDPLGALVDAVRGGHAFTGLLKGDRFRRLLEGSLPVTSFEACPTPLLLVATNLSAARSEVFSRGPLVPAVHATCAYPGLFRAVRHQGQLYWDGGIVDKAPVLALAESEAGRGLDALVVHYLPSRTRGILSGAFAYAQGMDAGLSAGRREHFELQLKVLKARGVPVHVVTSDLPPVSPRTMSRGAEAMEAARALTVRALQSPPV